MDDDGFDISAYLARIGYSGGVEPTLPVLRAIVAAHSAVIPFENIDVLLKRPIPLDVRSLQRKLVAGGRGGYCYEQNLLLLAALRAIGFTAVGLLARVVRARPADAPTPATHMLLRVTLPEGSYLADVGYGNLTPTAPYRLDPDIEQATLHETIRLRLMGAEYLLQTRLGDSWDNVYRFSTEPRVPMDFEVANWFTSTHAGSPFVHNLVIARPGAGRRTTLYNGRLSIRTVPGSPQRRDLLTLDDYRIALPEHFGLTMSDADVTAVHALMASRDEAARAHPYFS